MKIFLTILLYLIPVSWQTEEKEIRADNFFTYYETGNIRTIELIHIIQEKEKVILELKNALKKKDQVLTGCIAFIILFIFSIFLYIQNMKQTKIKKNVMAQQIKKIEPDKEKKDINDTLTSENIKIKEIFTLVDQKIRSDKLYLNPNLARDTIIRLLSVKRNDFIQAINQYTGDSFTNYINNIRLESALEILEKSSDINIETLAENTGFGSVRSFYRQFKQKYNMTPAGYRKLVKNRCVKSLNSESDVNSPEYSFYCR